MYVFMIRGSPMWDWVGMLSIQPLKDAILKQTENSRQRASMHLSHGSAPLREIYVALCGTNQIEATMLRVHSTSEKAG